MIDDDAVIISTVVDNAAKRLDSLLPELFPEEIVSRSRAQKLIDDCAVLVDGKPAKARTPVKTGAEVTVALPPAEEYDVTPENIPLDVVYEDNDIIVINKPRGMVVHPAAGNLSGTLVNALLYHCKDLSEIGGVVRPGIVHRIDKDTTGLIAAAKNDRAHLALAEQLKTRAMHRLYLAVAEGLVKPETGEISAPIGRSPKDRKKMAVVKGGREALTRSEVLCENADPVYGLRNTRGMAGQALHAGKLILTHPVSGEEMSFSCPPPADFEALLERTGLKPGERKFYDEIG